MLYSEKAHEILCSSINSAVFIDEKAKDFFSDTPIDLNVPEEKLSLNLYKTFKENGKNLTIHKFEESNLNDDKVIDFLFNNKDLILLDWELDDVRGQEHSLKLLSHTIKLPYVNFCCIYSSSSNFDTIPTFLDAYFSGLSKEELTAISNNFDHIEIKDIRKIQSNPSNINQFFEDNEINIQEFPIKRFREAKPLEILKFIEISIEGDKYFFSEDNKKFEVIHTSNNSFLINNTLVFTLKKEETDNDFSNLIKRISNEIIKNESSFFQLLGLEMQTTFNASEQFIDKEILKSSTEALFKFRNHLNDDKTFGIIIKKLLLEQATLKLRTAKLKLLESDFLNAHSETINDNQASIKDLMQLNTFYNAVSVKSLNDEDIPNLNFGDVFVDIDDNYYLCITALCDCYYPNKIQSNFYFVQGKLFKDPEVALKLGDTAFLSFIPGNKAIYWGTLDVVKKDKLKKTEEEDAKDFKLRKLENELKAYKNLLYKPFYVKPKIFNVENNKLINNKISIWDITNKIKGSTFNQDLNRLEIKYVTTLRNDYTQRIANHAFGHPARVGVDFVKIN